MITQKQTLFVGKIIHHFEILPSTNDYANLLLSKSKPSEGTVISTYNQTQGKGQHDSIWESSANQNLTLSILLQPTFLLPKHQFWLSQAIALAIRDFVADFITNKQVFIKWPNDIYIEDEKVAGILIQNIISGSTLSHSIIGSGININQIDFGFNSHRNPTSLAKVNKITYNLDELRQYLFWHIEVRYLQLKNNKIHKIQTDYMDHLYKYQIPHQYELPTGERFTGFIQGITPFGNLVINKNGELLTFGIKEVKFL